MITLEPCVDLHSFLARPPAANNDKATPPNGSAVPTHNTYVASQLPSFAFS